MMSTVYYGIGGAIAVMAIAAYNQTRAPAPVAENTQIVSIAKFTDRVEVMLEWDNVRDCEFTSLSTMQGSNDFPDELRTPIDRDLGPPKGPRGKGHQATVKPWVFYRPETIHAPDFIMTAWHRCGDTTVPSHMLVVPIRDWFPEVPPS